MIELYQEFLERHVYRFMSGRIVSVLSNSNIVRIYMPMQPHMYMYHRMYENDMHCCWPHCLHERNLEARPTVLLCIQ